MRSLWWKPTYIENGSSILSTVGKNAKAQAWTREVLDVSLLPEGLGMHISLQLAGWIWDLGLGIRVSGGCFEPLAWAMFFSSVYRHTLHWGLRAKTNQLSKCLAFFTIVSCLYVSFVVSQDGEVVGPAWYSDILESSGPGFLSVLYSHFGAHCSLFLGAVLWIVISLASTCQ